MKRLFLTLYALIVVGVFVLVFSLNFISSQILGTNNPDYAKRTYGGLFILLKELFIYDVDLVNFDGFLVSRKEKEILNNQGIVARNIDNGRFLYARSLTYKNLLWQLQIKQTQANINHELLVGPAKLIERALKKYPESDWSQHLKKLDALYPSKLSLIDFQNAELRTLSDQERLKLQQNRVIARFAGTKNERSFYRIGGSDQILRVGEFDFPVYLGWILPIGLGIIALFIAFVIYLWIRPLWRNLSELDLAASQFGRGDFSARSKITRFSPIKPLANNFNKMASRIQSLISSHKDLTNAVSHEIRTPLARMRFGLEMLETTDNADDKRRYAKEMATDIEELDDLVGELLTYAQFERSQPKMTLSEHKVLPWIEDQISRAQKLNKNIPISLSHDDIQPDQTVYFEDKLLARALSNLLRNALQYSNSKVRIHLEYNTIEFVINVEDDGDGIPEKFRATLFDPFTRVDESRSRETGGFGVGLAIVKQIADWHNASITIEDSTFGGAKFTMRITQDQQDK